MKSDQIHTFAKDEQRNPPRYIVIEGCIGVGKTTLTRLLAEKIDAQSLVEIVDENPFLADFYNDQEANAFKTQIFFLLSRFKQQEKISYPDLFRKNVIADYMFAKDSLFAELTLQGSELLLYQQIFDTLKSRVRKPDLIVFLQAPLEIILKRINKRGRDYEQDIDPNYLKQLIAAYQAYFSTYTDAPVLIVDTEDLNFPSQDSDVQMILDAAIDIHSKQDLAGKSRFFLGEHRQLILP